MKSHSLRLSGALVSVVLLSFSVVPGAAAQEETKAVPETLTATTTNMDPSGEGLKFNVLHWSSDADRAAALKAMMGAVAPKDEGDEQAESNVDDALGDLPTAGYVWLGSSSVGYGLKYTHRASTPEGGERITFVTDPHLGKYGRTPWAADGAETPRDLPFTVIELRGIQRNFRVGDQVVHALNHVDLDVEAGEYLSVMGPSGSGKSTLLNIIALLDQPSGGRYRLNGGDVTELKDDELARVRRENFGFVFQFFHLIPRLTAAENIEMPLVLGGIDPARRRDRVKEAVQAYHLVDRADHRPDQLSGGQRQRVAIARASIMRPGVLLADEPTGNLDRASGLEIVDLLEKLNGEGMALIIITHDPDLGSRAARRLTMLDGAIVGDSRAD